MLHAQIFNTIYEFWNIAFDAIRLMKIQLEAQLKVRFDNLCIFR